MKYTFKKFQLTLATSLAILIVALPLITTSVKADDTEVFVSAGNTANVLLIFDLSGSMNDELDGITKYQILLDSLTTVLGKLKDRSNLRIGLSVYGIAGDATGIRWPIRSISEDANLTDSAIAASTYQTHEIILKQLADYGTNGGTPLVDALLEAALYFKGDLVSNGNGAGEPPIWDGSTFAGGNALSAHPATYNPSTAWDSGTSQFDSLATYVSPILNSCDNNYIVLLTDGQPTVNSTVTKIENMIGSTCADPTSTNGKCGPELVTYLANTDLQSGAGITPSKVITHTIGFAVGGDGQAYLQNLAALGGGDFYSADDATALEQSLDTILTSIAGENESFSGLTTSVKSSTLSSDNRVFINIFKPSSSRSWIGNTKGYFIDSTKGLTDINDNEAIDSVTGEFKSTAQSFWSTSVDGNNVDQGGLSGKLDPVTRDIYTYVGTSPISSSPNLTKLATGDASIPAALFNAADDTEKDDLIDWLHNAPMGDPLHANAVTISYGGQDVLFTMTNQGLLHIIDVTSPTTTGDSSGGAELAAFIPQSLLPNIKEHRNNISGSDHLYGLDGSITYWHNDVDDNGIVDGADMVYLYFGMRRGGNQYFALNVTNPSSPSLAWRIDGGSAGFTTLGQTWSRPMITTIHWNSSPNKKVIIFGGGYNIAQDGYTLRTVDTVGNGVYIVEADTGNLLWSIGSDASHTLVNANMKYSIPSDLTVIDSDDDQHADRIYFGDMGGQIWRIDLAPDFSSGSGSDAFRLADFSVNAETVSANFRRFYAPPSVALTREGGTLHYAIAIGSGLRAHPTTTGVNDRFYMIKDTNLDSDGTASGSWTILSESDLYDTTLNIIGEGTTEDKATAKAALEGASGWYLQLTNSGEKALSPSLIFNYVLAFTTYTPAGATPTCGSAAGNGRLYLLNLKNATPFKDWVIDDELLIADRSKTLSGVGIPTTPVPYFPPGEGHVDIFTGKVKAATFGNAMVKINWKVIE